jgi:hypothetical protein
MKLSRKIQAAILSMATVGVGLVATGSPASAANETACNGRSDLVKIRWINGSETCYANAGYRYIGGRSASFFSAGNNVVSLVTVDHAGRAREQRVQRWSTGHFDPNREYIFGFNILQACGECGPSGAPGNDTGAPW